MQFDSLSSNTHTRLKFIADLTIWSIAGALAFILRQPSDWTMLGATIPLWVIGTLGVRALLIWAFKLHRQTWREVSVADLITLLKAVAMGTALFFVAGLIWHEVDGFPRTAPLISGVLAIVMMGGTRLAFRLYFEEHHRTGRDGQAARNVLLIGAGSAGVRMAREIRRHPGSGLRAVGFLDDDERKRKLSVSGLQVLGEIADLKRVCREHHVDEVLITMPSAPGRSTRRVVDLARDAGVACRILPGVTEILEGEVGLTRVRQVQVEDLLRRRPVELDFSRTRDYLRDATVMVTGAGGSIGSEIVRQVARLEPAQIVLFGQGENSLHRIDHELARDMPKLDRVVVVGTVRDPAKLEAVMSRFHPSVVFHAAAHKHVPMMESDPDEAVLNNVGGTLNTAEAALSAGVERFVNISTDKAVHPHSILGATKQLAEQVVRSAAQRAGSGQAFVSVRFGNVLGSRGSVIPIFQEQIRLGGPLTLTHPGATRYFMTIPEASRLVIQAGALAANGSVYILDMGDPVRIADLAQDMIRLSGTDPDDIEVVYTGLRPGERLEEELFEESEHAERTRFEQILVGRSETPMNPEFQAMVGQLLTAAARRDRDEIGASLSTLIDGFVMAADIRRD